MENDNRPQITPYYECRISFANSLTNKDLGKMKHIKANLIKVGVDGELVEKLIRFLPGDKFHKKIYLLKLGWETEWENKYPKIANLINRYKDISQDRFQNDTQFIQAMPDDLGSTNLEDFINDEELDGILEDVSTRAEHWVEKEEGLSPSFVKRLEAQKEYFIVIKMRKYLKLAGKPIPDTIKNFLKNPPLS